MSDRQTVRTFRLSVYRAYLLRNLKRIAEIQQARALLRLADWAKIAPYEALPSLPISSEKARYALAIELGPARSNREP
jgi:hypothetical protein